MVSLTLRRVKFLFVLILPLLGSCGHSVTREETIATAYRYTQIQWMPTEDNVRHGPDSKGIIVHTPDQTIERFGDTHGWWKPGKLAKSMPYQWGGFDTPESFLQKIAAGKKAGDVGDAAKRRLGDAGTSPESCGIDCSGFVSRCWNLSRPYSTRELHRICDPLKSWDDLLPGDCLLNDKHVILFVKWAGKSKNLNGYQAGPFPKWKVSSCGLSKDKLVKDGYSPWRYRGIIEKRIPIATAISDTGHEWR